MASAQRSASQRREFDEKATGLTVGPEYDHAPLSPQLSNMEATRLNDNLELLRAERLVSEMESAKSAKRTNSRRRSSELEDVFNAQQDPVAGKPAEPPSRLNKIWVKLKKFPRLIRYLVYMLPVGVLLLIPILLSIYVYGEGTTPVGGKGGVLLLWFGIWLETVWLSLWAARIATAIIPYIFKMLASMLGSTNSTNWKDIGHQLELPTALFLWMLAVLVSFLPIVNNHRAPNPDNKDGSLTDITWINVVQKIIVALFVLATLNFVEKILIQWITTSFHMRTYSNRIEQHKTAVAYLVELYEFSKQRLSREDSAWDGAPGQTSSGNKTPLRAFQNNARSALSGVGNVVNRMAGDFTGRKVRINHPRKVVMEMIKNTQSAQSLARLIFRSLKPDTSEVVTPQDLEVAFKTPEEAEGCFGMFDRDLNGDISMEELEATCDDIHREKKAIAASVKDLDSVIRKLDRVFVVIIFIIAAIVFVSIISGSAAAALTSAGTTILGLAWMLQATAQEFLQSIIFVFVKHPFDIGDRVTIYGNTGSTLTGDDYYVTAISLLYTEFKKMEGHIVQAPNSYLNNLFILNHRRSNALADPVTLTMRFGTAPELIEKLKERMLLFVEENKRDYQGRIITEVKMITDVYSFTMNMVFFHKSSFQNELLRLNRHNKFVSQLMYEMHALGIEGPRRLLPGGNPTYPFYWTHVPPPAYQSSEAALSNPTPPMHPIPEEHPGAVGGPGSGTGNSGAAAGTVATGDKLQPLVSNTSSAVGHRVDNHVSFALGRQNTGLDFQDVFESRKPDAPLHRGASTRSHHHVIEQLREEEGSDLGRHLSEGNESRRHLFGWPKRQHAQEEV